MAGFDVRPPCVFVPACVPKGDREFSPGLRELGVRCPGLSPRTRALKGHRNRPIFGWRIEFLAPLQGATHLRCLAQGIGRRTPSAPGSDLPTLRAGGAPAVRQK
jgi:hypothetical protein